MKRKAIRQRRAIAVLFAGLSTCPAIVRAATFTWDGSTTTGYGYLSEHDNWAGNVAPPTSGADLVFGSVNTHGYTPTLSQPYSINSLTFNASAVSYSIVASTLTLGSGGLTDSAANTETIGSSLVSGAAQSWYVNGNLTLNGNVNLSSYGLNMFSTGPGVVAFNGGVNGTSSIGLVDSVVGGVVFAGSAASSFGMFAGSGTVSLIGGTTVKLTNTTAPIYMVNGGALNVSSGATLDTSADTSSNAVYQTGEEFDGGTAVTVTGTNSKFVGGANLYIGYTTVGSLTVTQMGKASTTQDLLVGFYNGSSGTVMINSGGSVTTPYLVVAAYSGSTGNVTVSGAGSNLNVTAQLLVSNGGNGTVTVSSGATVTSQETTFAVPCTLNVSGGTFTTAALDSGTSLANVGTILLTDGSGPALTINGNASSSIYTGTISGTGSLVKSGNSTQTLAGDNTFTGACYVQGGNLVLYTGASYYYEVDSGATLVLANGMLGTAVINAEAGGTVIYGGPTLSGGYLQGSGTHSLTNVSTIAGTTIENGTTITPNAGTFLRAVTNSGTIVNPYTATLYWYGGSNAGGNLNVSGFTHVSQWTSSGIVRVNAGGYLYDDDATTSMVLLGGSETYVGSAAAPGGQIALSGGPIQLDGGLLVNNGTITGGTVYVNYGGLATGPDSYSGGIVVNPGGTFLPGNYGSGSPSAVPGSPFALIAPATNGSTGTTVHVTVNTGAQITVNPGSSLTLGGGLNATGQTVTLLGGGTAIVPPFSALGLNVSNGVFQISPSVAALQIGSLTIGATSKLDLTSDAADISGGNLAVITAAAMQGYNNSSWTGSGLTSSSAAANAKHLTAVGVIQNNQSGTAIFSASRPFDGVVPGPGDILVAYTYYGDANLDGKVDGSDYSLIDNGYSKHLTGWYNGDFNYDGVVDGSDYTLIDNAFNSQGSPLPAATPSPTAQTTDLTAASVPEPAASGFLITCTLGAFGRRSSARDAAILRANKLR